MPNPFENALSQIDRAAAVAPVSDELLARLRKAEREISVSIPVVMDSGKERVFEGYRVQHNSLRGPYKGGIRFHEATDIDEVRALALWMTMKTAVAGIGMGGGKGGVTVNPKEFSALEIERLSRGFVRALYRDLGPRVDVPAPDVNTTPEIMAIMVDEYQKLTGDTTGATFTGKPLTHGGSQGRGAATGQGGFAVFSALRSAYGLGNGLTVAIQGMGNVGGHAARIFSAAGHKIVTMSDSKGGVYNPQGLDVAAVEAYKKERGSLEGFSGGEAITNAALLEVACDVLIPAALENQITADNAARIQAKMVLELANGPTTPEADDILFAKGIAVVPDILANAGGVVVSTFEWEQNLKHEAWSEEDVLLRLTALLEDSSREVLERAQRYGTDLRRAAFLLALERLELARTT
ncbi:Glu/Leu/Phe/Val dehydrogenase [Patescibacteria group bacterium]|nr:Glu/Leu/Phe/Val dehydrogenase [Patescibacteria group bacterium]